MVRLNIKAMANQDRIRAVEAALRVNVQDLKVMTRNVDSVFRKQSEQLFSTEGASGGVKWASLSVYYAAVKSSFRRTTARANRWSKKAAAPFMSRPVSQKILQWTGNMMRSFTRAGHSEHIARAEGPLTRPFIVVGSSNELAYYHFTGNPAGNLPARNPIARTVQQMDELVEPVRTYMVEKARAVARSLRRAMGAWGVRR